MKYSVNITEEAKQDLYAVFLYILENSCSLDIAKRRVDEPEKSIVSLETMPYRHQALFSNDKSREKIRVFHTLAYAIIYEIDEVQNCINVLAIFSDKQKLPLRFSENVMTYAHQNG